MVVTRGNLEPTSENAMTDQADHVAGGSDDGNDGNNKSSQTATPAPTSRMDSTTTTKHQYCITECQHGHSSSGNMIRCCMCYVWCHEDCVKFDKNLDTRWFVCPPCRGMSHRIHDLENTMSVLLNTVNKQRVLMHRHQGLNVRHGLCHIYMRYLYIYIYELFIAFVCFVVCS